MTTTATLTPYDLSEAVKVGNKMYRKQILALSTINYKGKKIKFDRGFLADLAESFKDGAYDQVPFQLADADNRHNLDPERTRGELVGVELTDDGLDGIFSVTDDGAKIIESNPKLGVSARIVQALEKSDGRSFKRAINHVLGTLDPRVTKMRPWQAVDLSEADKEIEVVDLTAATVKKGSLMATKSKTKKAVAKPSNGVVTVTTSKGERNIDLSALSDEEFQALLDMSSQVEDDEVDEEEEDEDVRDVDTDEVDDDEDDESDDEEEDEEDEESADLAVPPAFLKNQKGKKKTTVKGQEADEVPTPGAAKKGKAKKKAAAPAFSLSVAQRLAEGEWRRERREYVRAGVPPYMLDLAAPILSAPEAVLIDLSEDDSIDAGGVVRKILDAAKGYIEQKPEIGHQIDLSEDDDKPSGDEAFLSAWDTEYGKA